MKNNNIIELSNSEIHEIYGACDCCVAYWADYWRYQGSMTKEGCEMVYKSWYYHTWKCE